MTTQLHHYLTIVAHDDAADVSAVVAYIDTGGGMVIDAGAAGDVQWHHVQGSFVSALMPSEYYHDVYFDHFHNYAEQGLSTKNTI